MSSSYFKNNFTDKPFACKSYVSMCVCVCVLAGFGIDESTRVDMQ